MEITHRYDRVAKIVVPLSISLDDIKEIKKSKNWSLELADKYGISYCEVVNIRNNG